MANQESKAAVVTGSNKGIGFEIVKQLASKGIRTVLTARDVKRGSDALEQLKSQGLDVEFHQLDVSSSSSVSAIASWLQQKFGSIDILVNNAGITSKSFGDKTEGARAVLETNYYGAKRMTEALLPLIKPGGRIINISSRLGQFNNGFAPMTNKFQVEKLSVPPQDLSEEVIESCLQEFLKAEARGKLTEEGYPATEPDYCMSKSALNAYTRLLALRLKDNICVNSVCPGYTRTDMTGGEGNHAVEQGADTAVWLALLHADDYPSGKFFAERQEIHF